MCSESSPASPIVEAGTILSPPPRRCAKASASICAEPLTKVDGSNLGPEYDESVWVDALTKASYSAICLFRSELSSLN
jgi:hypothetical protein